MIYQGQHIQHFHFIGIGGIGMSGIATLLAGLGYSISGSDIRQSKVTERLQRLGVSIHIGHAAKNLAPECQLVVYSSAVKEDNVEMQEARRRGLPVVSRAYMLAWLMKRQQSIAVAGAHGKTTTSAMIALMLEGAGFDPSIVVGGEMPPIGGNAKLGKGEYIVVEADESDGSFLILYPDIIVVTNIENDHLDHYGSMENMIRAFEQFIEQMPEQGFAVLGIDCDPVAQIAERSSGSFITYGLKNSTAEYSARDIVYGGRGSCSQVYYLGEHLGELRLNVPGEYNVSNALAALAVGRKLGLSFQTAAAGLARFTGTGRRFECLGRFDGVTVVDDYAHHPTEVAATLHAAKQMDYSRVIAVFQPHRYTRTQLLAEEFGTAFRDADILIFNEIYSASETPIPGVSAQLLVDSARRHGQADVRFAATEDDVLRELDALAQPGDLILVMGAGNIRHAGERLVEEHKR